MAQATVSIRLGNEYSDIKLVVSTNSGLSNPIYSNSYSTVNRTIKITMNNLTPNTQYYYGVMIKGILQTKGRGMFKTFPEGASNFTCAFASCAENGSNHQVFETIRNLNPLFFIHMGDMHYSDITINNPNLYRNAFDQVFSSSRQAKLYSEIPTAYMWDDHDFGNNINGDKNNPAKDSAIRVYRERVPHYSTPANNELDAVYQSWVCGRVRFILTDLRSQADNYSMLDSAEKSIMGEKQLQWFFDELTKPEPLKIWVNTRPWIGEASLDEGDIWKAFSYERKRIANFISENNLEGHVAIVSGDMHGIAIDDGTNSDYSDDGNASIPVFQAAPLHRTPSVKGGPWTSGSFPNAGDQFGIMNIVDGGGETITIEWIGRRGNEVITSHNFSVSSTMPKDVRPPIIKANPIGGSYVDSQVIALTANEEATIYYTVDGTEPTINSNVYAYPIEISDDITLKYFGVDLSNNASQVQTENYIFIDDNIAPTISVSVPDGETFASSLEIELIANEPSIIYYTLNNDTPTTSSNVYNDKITIYNTTILKYFGVDSAGNVSVVQTVNYVKVPITEGVTPTYGLRLWIDAKESTSVLDNDNKVSQIADLSGNNNHLTQSILVNQPILVRDAYGEGRHSVRFNGSSSYIKNEIFTSLFNKSTTIVLVTSLKDPDGVTQRLLDLSSSTSSLRSFHKSGTTDNLASQNSIGASYASFNVRSLPIDSLHVITNVITHEKSIMYLNGVEAGYTLDSNPNLNAISKIALGSSINGSNFFNGDISEIIIYNRALTEEELLVLHSDLGKKWVIDVPEIPDTPNSISNLTASNITSNSLTLIWTTSSNATSYDVYQNGTLIGNTTNTTYNIVNLSPSSQYTFGVIAKNTLGESSIVTIPAMTLESEEGYLTLGLQFRLEGDVPANHEITNSNMYFSELNPFTICFAYKGELSQLLTLLKSNGGVSTQDGVNIERTAANRLNITGRALDTRDNTSSLRYYSTGSSVFVDSNNAILKHVIYVRDTIAGFVFLYINGVKVGENNVFGTTYSINAPSHTNIMLNTSGVEMKDVLIYNRALTATEVTHTYNIFNQK